MDLKLSAVGRQLIDAVIDAPVAWRSPGELAERLGWSLDQTLDEIATLDAGGWLEAWELIDGPVVTLSVAATVDSGVRLVEVGHDETPRWARSGDPDPPHQRASGVFRSEKAAALNLVADARPGAELAAILAEEAEGLVALHGHLTQGGWTEKRPRPTLLIGGGLSPWPGPRQVEGEDCPACRLAHLPAQAYCLWCDRWGLDVLTPESRAARRKQFWQTAVQAQGAKMEARKHTCERRKRRRKRQERRQLQAERQSTSPPHDRARWANSVAVRLVVS